MSDENNDLPDRISLDPRSPHIDEDILSKGVGFVGHGERPSPAPLARSTHASCRNRVRGLSATADE
jgi:hypothetical protein